MIYYRNLGERWNTEDLGGGGAGQEGTEREEIGASRNTESLTPRSFLQLDCSFYSTLNDICYYNVIFTKTFPYSVFK